MLVAHPEVNIVEFEPQKEQAMSQLQGPPADEAQMMQLDSLIATLISQGMQEVKAMSAQISGGGEQDPLIALKEQDLQIRAQYAQKHTVQSCPQTAGRAGRAERIEGRASQDQPHCR